MTIEWGDATRTVRKGAFTLRRCAAAGAAGLAAAALLSCAAAMANRPSPGTLANGMFAATRPAVESYSTKPDLACPSGGAFAILADDLASSARDDKRPAPEADGRLCALADTLLGWDEKEAVPESVVRYLAWHFGIPTRVPRVFVTVLETEDAPAVAQRLYSPAANYAADAKAPRFGAATRRVKKGVTKAVVVAHDVQIELAPVPKRVPASGQVTISGRLLGAAVNAKVLASDPGGKLETFDGQPGGAFRADIKCNDHQGMMPVEIRSEKDGIVNVAANFPVYCGTEPPTSVAVSPPETGGVFDANAKARQLFDLMNRERTSAGRPALTWDDAVAAVARSAAERLQATGDANSFNAVQALKAADVASPVVLQNPALATTVQEANATISASPVDRANVLAPEVTHAGVGVVPGTAPDGRAIVYVTELLIRQQPPANVAEVKTKLREAIDRRRTESRVGKVTDDPLLTEIAQKYADLLAHTRGEPPKAREDAIIAPLYRAFRTVNITAGVKNDPMEFAEEPAIVGNATVVGVGAALGTSPVLGKNSVYVVVLTGTKR